MTIKPFRKCFIEGLVGYCVAHGTAEMMLHGVLSVILLSAIMETEATLQSDATDLHGQCGKSLYFPTYLASCYT